MYYFIGVGIFFSFLIFFSVYINYKIDNIKPSSGDSNAATAKATTATNAKSKPKNKNN